MERNLSLSICMPVYKGSGLLKDTLSRILTQSFTDYELIIGDDNPLELEDEILKTKNIISSFHDERIKYIKNQTNLGYPRNLKKLVSLARGEIIFLFAQDDVIAKDALQKTHDAFSLADDIGVVTRPYYWFYDDLMKPVRAVLPFDKNKNVILSIHDGEKAILKVIESIGQLSGLAYRKAFIEIPFHEDVFPAHIYPFLGIFKKHKCVFLKDYTVAVGIKDSQTRHVSSIYNKSPTESWMQMFNSVFSDSEYNDIKKSCVKSMATNFVGLVQIKNYSTYNVLMCEIILLAKYRWQNLLDPRFWFFSIGTLLVPKIILRPMVDNYKNNIISMMISNVHFNY